jgi:hypothetical protein
MTKISVAWLGVLAIVAILVFFSYQIASAANAVTSGGPVAGKEVRTVRFAEVEEKEQEPVRTAPLETGAPVAPSKTPNTLPRVPGQTVEDLMLDGPVKATPPATQYDPPDATDPLNGVAFQDAEFGSNLRHPEQMIEKQPRRRMATAPGVASERSAPGANNAQGYSEEMIQNGGNFMGAVLAFDGSEVGNAYSLL